MPPHIGQVMDGWMSQNKAAQTPVYNEDRRKIMDEIKLMMSKNTEYAVHYCVLG